MRGVEYEECFQGRIVLVYGIACHTYAANMGAGTCYVDCTGHIAKNQWIEDETGKHYVDRNGYLDKSKDIPVESLTM